MKRKEHRNDPEDIELNEFEFRLVMGDSWNRLSLYTDNIFCTCSAPNRKLVNYKAYLTKLNDIVLKGSCSGCMTIAARYIEVGENMENFKAAERIKKMKKGDD